MTNCKAALTLAAVLFAAPVHALTIDAVSVTGSDPITFSVTFNAVPDLVTVDEYGRPRDQFGFWITTALLPSGPYMPDPELALVSGGGKVVAYDGANGDSLAAFTYSLTGSTVTFSASARLISDAQFRWKLLVGFYGKTTDEEVGYGGLIDPHAVVPVARTSWGGVKAVYAGR